MWKSRVITPLYKILITVIPCPAMDLNQVVYSLLISTYKVKVSHINGFQGLDWCFISVS